MTIGTLQIMETVKDTSALFQYGICTYGLLSFAPERNERSIIRC